jgi:hypothetical protein
VVLTPLCHAESGAALSLEGPILKSRNKKTCETQTFKEELKEVRELNEVSLDHNQELETRQAQEIQAKNDSYSLCPLHFLNHVRIEFWTVIAALKEQLTALGVTPGNLNLTTKALADV